MSERVGNRTCWFPLRLIGSAAPYRFGRLLKMNHLCAGSNQGVPDCSQFFYEGHLSVLARYSRGLDQWQSVYDFFHCPDLVTYRENPDAHEGWLCGSRCPSLRAGCLCASLAPQYQWRYERNLLASGRSEVSLFRFSLRHLLHSSRLLGLLDAIHGWHAISITIVCSIVCHEIKRAHTTTA